VPLYFHDYGLQVFTHIEYDILNYILRNTIGWKDDKNNYRKDFHASIKTIALMKRYNEKNIIKAINNLIEKTGVFDKVVYREKGSCLKKTKYFITENSVELLNEYVKKNMPADFFERKKAIENRTIEAGKRLSDGKEKLLKRQQELLQSVKDEAPAFISLKTENTDETEITDEKQDELFCLLDAYREIINDFDPDECCDWQYNNFKEYKDGCYESYMGHIPDEKDDGKIDIRLSDLIYLTDDIKTIDFYNTLIKNKRFTGNQSNYFYDTLKMNFGIINENNFVKINIVFA
jgi:hypothetical protein